MLIQDPSVLVIPATGHTAGSEWLSTDTEHYQLCTVCQEEINKQAHTFAWVVDTPATEEEAGVKHEECSVCGKTRNENTEIPKLDHTHTGIVHHPAVAATCTAAGNVEYWTCSSPLCEGKYYSDENCTTEIADVKIAVNPANHAGGTETRNASEATCITDGYTGDTYCKGCGAKLTTGTVIPATGEHVGGEWQHDETGHWKTCTTPGCGAVVDKGAHELAYRHNAVNHWQACTVCGMTGEPAAHTFGDWRVTKEATESADGIKERACTVCGYAETARIPATGTKPADSSSPAADSASQSGGVTSQTQAGESAAATLPQTGDESSLLLWIVLLAVSGGALGIVTYKKRQSN